MTKSLRFLLGVTALCVAAPATAQTSVPTPAPSLQTGDSLILAVWRKPELSGGFRVGANGAIHHPLYQEVEVAGVPLEAAQQRLKIFLQRFEANPQFVVQPFFRVVVGGAVANPSLYYFGPEITIPEAITLAGGATEDAGRVKKVRLIRDGQLFQLSLDDRDANSLRIPVRSGDQIIVEGRRRNPLDYAQPVISVLSTIGSFITMWAVLTK